METNKKVVKLYPEQKMLMLTATVISSLLIAEFLTGCGMLLGVKEIKTGGGTQIKFATGFDFGVAANAIDTVDDRRGIKPEGGNNGNN